MGSRFREEARSGLRKWVLAIDPGNTMGWALFLSGDLYDSGFCKKEAVQSGELTPQAVRAGHSLPPDPGYLDSTCLIVGEMPTYRGQRGEKEKNVATPKDLISLGIALGQATGLYMRKVEVIEFVTPNEWKGSVPKDICHSRVKKTLKPEESMPDNHNERDAVGIGLWYLGRYRR